MSGGRPSQGRQERYPELEELADWFTRAVAEGGYESVHAFLQRTRMFDKHVVYGLAGATRPLKLEEIRALAAALRRRPQEAEGIWRRAKQAGERRLAQEQQHAKAIKSWDELPTLPNLPVRDLLEAQRDSAYSLPYRKLMVRPPDLSAIYVRQRVRHQPPVRLDRDLEEDGDKVRETFDLVVTAVDALNRYQHVLLTGDPGSGKSTLGHYFTALLARRWLQEIEPSECPIVEPVMPLRVPARELIREGAWSTVLAAAANRTLRLDLMSDVTPQMLERRVHGARWLIFIDGLDEISDVDQRNIVLRAIAHHARPGGDFRFVITTRALPDAELSPLRGEHFGQYEMEPFEARDLEAFARQWFLAQDRRHGPAMAARYLHQVSDNRLRELVRSPLLATIAAVVHTREPNSPLPTNRVDLYDRFYGYLVYDEASGRSTLADLRLLLSDQPERLRLTEWGYSHRTKLIEHLGRLRVETEEPMLGAATRWIADHRPQDLQLRLGWEEDVRQLLIGTGVFVHEGPDIRFLHHSFAEFLSAGGFAAALPPDVEGADAWLWRRRRDYDRDLVLFTLILWGRRQDSDLSELIRRLLRGGPKRVPLAGRLLAEGAEIPAEVVGDVVSRLINLALANDGADYYDVLGGMCENEIASGQLQALLDQAELPSAARVQAAIALGRVIGPAQAMPRLQALVVEALPRECLDIGRALVDQLTESERSVAISIIGSIADKPESDADVLASAAEMLYDLGQTETALRMVRAALARRPTSSGQVGSVAKIALKLHGPTAGEDIVLALTQYGLDAWGQSRLAEEFARAGRGDLAMPFVTTVFADPYADGYDLGTAAQAWYQIAGPAAADDIAAAVHARTALLPSDQLILAAHLSEAGLNSLILRLVRLAAEDPTLEDWKVADVASKWVKTAGATGGEDLADLIEQQPFQSGLRLAYAAEGLAGSGCAEPARRLARKVLASAQSSGIALGTAAKALVITDDGTAADEILSLVADRWTTLPTFDRAIFAQDLADVGIPICVDIATSVLADQTLSAYAAECATEALLQAIGDAATSQVLGSPSISSGSPETLAAVAKTLAEFGATQVALMLLVRLLLAPATSLEQAAGAAAQMVLLGQRSSAVTALRTALGDSALKPQQRSRLKAALAWISFTHPQADSCGLDVSSLGIECVGCGTT